MNRVDRMFELLMEVAEVQKAYSEKLLWGKHRDALYNVTHKCYDKFKSEVRKEVNQEISDLEHKHDIDIDMISFTMNLDICRARISVLYGDWGLIEEEMEQAFAGEIERIYDEDSLKQVCKNNKEMFDEFMLVCIDEMKSIITRLLRNNTVSKDVTECFERLTQILRKMEEIEG